jgi:hypothetical protein
VCFDVFAVVVLGVVVLLLLCELDPPQPARASAMTAAASAAGR